MRRRAAPAVHPWHRPSPCSTSSTGNGVGGATGSAYRYSDLDLIDNSIQANAVPLTVTAVTLSATATAVTVVGTITVTGSAANRTDADLKATASTALTTVLTTVLTRTS